LAVGEVRRRGSRRAEHDVTELGGHRHEQVEVELGVRGGQVGRGAGAGDRLGEPGR
jgi:hypothetical protein